MGGRGEGTGQDTADRQERRDLIRAACTSVAQGRVKCRFAGHHHGRTHGRVCDADRRVGKHAGGRHTDRRGDDRAHQAFEGGAENGRRDGHQVQCRRHQVCRRSARVSHTARCIGQEVRRIFGRAGEGGLRPPVRLCRGTARALAVDRAASGEVRRERRCNG